MTQVKLDFGVVPLQAAWLPLRPPLELLPLDSPYHEHVKAAWTESKGENSVRMLATMLFEVL